jgi:hypothetical protein
MSSQYKSVYELLFYGEVRAESTLAVGTADSVRTVPVVKCHTLQATLRLCSSFTMPY